MRRVRHLEQVDYIVPIGQKSAQSLLLSNCNILLERTWHGDNKPIYNLAIHAKFNADTMNGVQISARLFRNGNLCSSSITSFRLYRVTDASWVETLVATVVPTESSFGVFTATINQATLGVNELSGKEVYAVEAVANRKRKKYLGKVWFNHLGVFDNINLARQKIDFLDITKVDE